MEVVIDKNDSKVLIIRNYVDSDTSTNLCEKLKTELAWRSEELLVYGKRIMQPRRIYACGDPGLTYRYSGLSIPVTPWIPEVLGLKERISEESGITFNSCLLNEYRNGQDYIGYHSDREALGPGNTVVTISLGGSRDFYFKSKSKPPETIKTTLHTGDCVIMCGKTQEDYTHSIPKRAQADYRISLTFRQIQ